MATEQQYWSSEFQLQFARHQLGAHAEFANRAVIAVGTGPGEFAWVAATRLPNAVELEFTGRQSGTTVRLVRCQLVGFAASTDPFRPVLLVAYARILQSNERWHVVGTYNLKGDQNGMLRILDTH